MSAVTLSQQPHCNILLPMCSISLQQARCTCCFKLNSTSALFTDSIGILLRFASAYAYKQSRQCEGVTWCANGPWGTCGYTCRGSSVFKTTPDVPASRASSITRASSALVANPRREAGLSWKQCQGCWRLSGIWTKTADLKICNHWLTTLLGYVLEKLVCYIEASQGHSPRE